MRQRTEKQFEIGHFILTALIHGATPTGEMTMTNQNTFKISTARFALALGLVLAAASAPALARGNGGNGGSGGSAGNGGEIGGVMAVAPAIAGRGPNRAPPKLPRRLQTLTPCGGLTAQSTRACQYGS